MRFARVTVTLFVFWLVALALAGTFGSFGVAGWTLLTVLGVSPLIVARHSGRASSIDAPGKV